VAANSVVAVARVNNNGTPCLLAGTEFDFTTGAQLCVTLIEQADACNLHVSGQCSSPYTTATTFTTTVPGSNIPADIPLQLTTTAGFVNGVQVCNFSLLSAGPNATVALGGFNLAAFTCVGNE
jgi:hypothetical protein